MVLLVCGYGKDWYRSKLWYFSSDFCLLVTSSSYLRLGARPKGPDETCRQHRVTGYLNRTPRMPACPAKCHGCGLRRLIDNFQEVKFWSAERDSDSVGFPQTCQSSQTERPQEREEYMAAILSCVGSFFNGSVLPVETRVHWAAAGVKWQETSFDKLIRHCNWERLVKSWQSGRCEGQKKEREGSTPTEAFPGVHCQGRVCRTGCFRCSTFAIVLVCFWHTCTSLLSGDGGGWWRRRFVDMQSRRLLRFLGRFYSHCPAARKSWGTIWI